MPRRHLMAGPTAAIASMLIATVALAGGWATVTVADPDSDPVAGGTAVLDLTVLQHGQTPVSWPRITVIATLGGSDATIRAAAVPSGVEGHYTVSLTLPVEGRWALTFDSADLMMQGRRTVGVVAGAAPPPVVTPPAPAPAIAPDPAIAAGIAAAAAALVVAAGLSLIRARRRVTGDQRESGAPAPGVTS